MKARQMISRGGFSPADVALLDDVFLTAWRQIECRYPPEDADRNVARGQLPNVTVMPLYLCDAGPHVVGDLAIFDWQFLIQLSYQGFFLFQTQVARIERLESGRNLYCAFRSVDVHPIYGVGEIILRSKFCYVRDKAGVAPQRGIDFWISKPSRHPYDSDQS